MSQPDTSNKFLVRPAIGPGEAFWFETPTASPILCRLTRDDALNLAAWLVALADRDGAFDRILAEVKR